MAHTAEQYEQISEQLEQVRQEIGRYIVGQEETIDFVLYAILADRKSVV